MILYGYTLEEARYYREEFKKCLTEVSTSAVKRYKIGTREYEAKDSDEIISRIKDFDDTINYLMNGAKVNRVKRFVPRDL